MFSLRFCRPLLSALSFGRTSAVPLDCRTGRVYHPEGLGILKELCHTRVFIHSSPLPLSFKKILQRILANSVAEECLDTRYGKHKLCRLLKSMHCMVKCWPYVICTPNNYMALPVRRRPRRVGAFNSIFSFCLSVKSDLLLTLYV